MAWAVAFLVVGLALVLQGGGWPLVFGAVLILVGFVRLADRERA